MTEKPPWKDIVNRDYVKDVIRTVLKRAAKGHVEEEIGKGTNDLCRYLTSELLLNTREVMDGIKKQLDEAMEFLEKYAGGIDEKIVQRRAQMMEEKEDQ